MSYSSRAQVGQLSGYVSEHSAYHHGDVSLQGTIIGLAQDFVGSNNLNMLDPNGQFGTRLQGGKDAASARYIFTNVAQVTRTIFHPADDAILDYLNDDGQSIEPSWCVALSPPPLPPPSSLALADLAHPRSQVHPRPPHGPRQRLGRHRHGLELVRP